MKSFNPEVAPLLKDAFALAMDICTPYMAYINQILINVGLIWL